MRVDPSVVDHWSPALVDRNLVQVNRDIAEGRFPARRPAVGSLITTRAWRKPMRVVHIDEIEPLLWSDEDRRRVDCLKESYRREHAPFRIIVVPDGIDVDNKDAWQPYRVHARASADWYFALPEHYAVCRHCDELAPCMELTSQRLAVAAMKRQDEVDARLMPGCCPACGHPVTRRQRAVTFPGENLLSPLAHASPTYHLRAECRRAAEQYEERWVAADPTRPRSLLTLRCAGTLIVHGDGTAECFGADQSDCPSPAAAHRSYTSCYAQSHGCGRECPREGHPGARGFSWSEFGEHGQPIA